MERPNWRIAGPSGLYVPRVDEDGLLQEDYLLVTRARNYLSTGSIDAGHYIVSFGGAHGTGTRALSILYRDRTILRKLSDQLRARPASFQFLLRVGDIAHDPVNGSHARSLELVGDAMILPDSDSIWRTAQESVRGRL